MRARRIVAGVATAILVVAAACTPGETQPTVGTIRVDSRPLLDFGPEKWGTNASFFLHPSFLNEQLASRGSQATGFMRFPGGIAAQVGAGGVGRLHDGDTGRGCAFIAVGEGEGVGAGRQRAGLCGALAV